MKGLHRLFSPRTWGCFPAAEYIPVFTGVFPTYVGVFLEILLTGQKKGRFPHVRGGVSIGNSNHQLNSVFSPRTWGCFQEWDEFGNLPKVFPTYVGVFLEPMREKTGRVRFPHVRGGVS